MQSDANEEHLAEVDLWLSSRFSSNSSLAYLLLKHFKWFSEASRDFKLIYSPTIVMREEIMLVVWFTDKLMIPQLHGNSQLCNLKSMLRNDSN